MKLSIIVPVYNAERFLRPCLDSLVKQTVDDYEIIIVNDGSTDMSQSIVEDYVNQYPGRIRALTVENGGQGRARNIALGLARGDYIGFADSDDWAAEDMFEKLYSAAQAEKADMVVCDAVKCIEGGEREYLPMSRYEDPMSITTAVWNKLFRRELIEDIRFPEGLWYEDAAFVIKAVLNCGKTARVGEGLYFYRCGQTSTMNNRNAVKNLDIIGVMEELKGYMIPRGYEREFEAVLISHLLLDTINRVNIQKSPDGREVIARLRAYARENIPSLLACTAYRAQPIKRKIVMALNYYGLHPVARLLFKKK